MQLPVYKIEEWIKRNPKASICTTEGIESFRRIANFQDYHGLPEFTSVSFALNFLLLFIIPTIYTHNSVVVAVKVSMSKFVSLHLLGTSHKGS